MQTSVPPLTMFSIVLENVSPDQGTVDFFLILMDNEMNVHGMNSTFC